MTLTAKQELFAREYLVDLNATQAAIRAGYSAKTAYSIGEELLRKPEIVAIVQQAQAKRLEKVDVNATRVLQEMVSMALFDPADYVGVTGPAAIADLPENVRRAIVGWSWDKAGNFTIKFDKRGTLQMLGHHLGMFVTKVEDVTDPLKKAMGNMSHERAEQLMNALDQVEAARNKGKAKA